MLLFMLEMANVVLLEPGLIVVSIGIYKVVVFILNAKCQVPIIFVSWIGCNLCTCKWCIFFQLSNLKTYIKNLSSRSIAVVNKSYIYCLPTHLQYYWIIGDPACVWTNTSPHFKNNNYWQLLTEVTLKWLNKYYL